MFHSVMAKLQKEADSGVRTQPWVIMVGRDTQRTTDLRNGRYGISDGLGYLELGT